MVISIRINVKHLGHWDTWLMPTTLFIFCPILFIQVHAIYIIYQIWSLLPSYHIQCCGTPYEHLKQIRRWHFEKMCGTENFFKNYMNKYFKVIVMHVQIWIELKYQIIGKKSKYTMNLLLQDLFNIFVYRSTVLHRKQLSKRK